MKAGRKKQMALGAVLSYIQIGVHLLSGLVYTPIILRMLGQGEYGIYSLCISFVGYLTLFNTGMNAAYVRFYVQARETQKQKLKELNGTFLKIMLALGLIGLAAGLLIGSCAPTLFGSRILPSEYAILQKSFYILGAVVFLSTMKGIFSAVIVAHEKFIVVNLVDCLHMLLVPVFAIPFLLLGCGSVAILLVQLCVTGIMALFNALYSIRKLHLRFDWKRSDALLLRSIGLFAGFIAIQIIMDQLNWQVDKLILARVRGAEAVAVYSVGSQFNNIYISLSTALAGVFVTEINRLVAHGDNAQVSSLFVRTSRILAFICVFVMSGFIIFGRPFIAWWAGAEYSDSYLVAVLIMLPMTVPLVQELGQDIARAKNLHKMQILINTCICFLNFAVSIPLAIRFGAVGSALGTFACEIVIYIGVQSIYYQRVIKLDMKAHYREMLHILPGWLLPFAFGWALVHFGLIRANFVSILVYGLLYTAIYLCSIWLFSMKGEEKDQVRSVLRKVFG